MAIDMSQFHQVFFDETVEHLATMESLLLAMDVAQPDPEDLNAVFRAAHSIKGGAATFGFSDLAEFTHVLENLLDRIRKHEMILTIEMVDLFLESKDVLKTMLEAHQGGPVVEPEWAADVSARLERLADVQHSYAAVPTVQELPSAEHVVPVPGIHDLLVEIDWLPGFSLEPVLDALKEHGEIDLIQDASPDHPGVLRFTTALNADDVRESLAFILPVDQFRLCLDAGAESGGDDGFGLFLDEPAKPVDGLELGVFACESGEVEGFGLFEPMTEPEAETLPPTADVFLEEPGFGLFVSPEAAVAAPAPAKSAPAPVVPPQPAPSAMAPATRSVDKASVSNENSIRVSIEKVDLLLNLMGELVITQSMLMQSGSYLDAVEHERLINGINTLQRNSKELQEAVMSIRMTPIAFVFNRFPRVVRDLAGKLGKQVELKMVGENTELDKGFIEKLSDPLTHLVRNSLDHGLELPDVRRAKGKSPVGRLTLRAFHQGGSIVIEVNDDGAGLNKDRILAKAKERGLPVSDSMDDQDVWGLIFEAGFSTANEITDVSGRGVGMDVVKRNIQGMGGRIDIDSMQDFGTTISIRLPLTLAIMDGMSVRIGTEIYVIPLSFVLESMQPAAGEVKTVGGRSRVVHIRGEYLPIVGLGDYFKAPEACDDPLKAILIVVEAAGLRLALQVDDLIGQQQFVVKNLETNYRKVDGISGATIMGDGHVALILDVITIARNCLRNSQPVNTMHQAESVQENNYVNN